MRIADVWTSFSWGTRACKNGELNRPGSGSSSVRLARRCDVHVQIKFAIRRAGHEKPDFLSAMFMPWAQDSE